jgi:hypothetical protein
MREIPTVNDRLALMFALTEQMLDARMGYGDVCITLPHWQWAADQFEKWAAANSERPYQRQNNGAQSVVFSFNFDYIIFRPALSAGEYDAFSLVIALDADLDVLVYHGEEADDDD